MTKINNNLAFFVGVYAAIVMMAWKSNLIGLVSVISGAVPMQFNTALGFFIAAIGVSAIGRSATIQQAAGLFLLVLGLATSYQWLTEVNLGIDQLLHKHQYTAYTPAPGRMAPNTAISFSCFGLVLLFWRRQILATAFSVPPMAFGIIGLIGYAFSASWLFQWGEIVTGMAVNTAVSFVVCSAAALSEIARTVKTHEQTL